MFVATPWLNPGSGLIRAVVAPKPIAELRFGASTAQKATTNEMNIGTPRGQGVYRARILGSMV